MNEKLLHDYWLESGKSNYPDFKIEIQTVAGGCIIFHEEECGTYGYFKQHNVGVFDVVAWVYSKMNL